MTHQVEERPENPCGHASFDEQRVEIIRLVHSRPPYTPECGPDAPQGQEIHGRDQPEKAE
jgi:hypothetical protein